MELAGTGSFGWDVHTTALAAGLVAAAAIALALAIRTRATARTLARVAGERDDLARALRTAEERSRLIFSLGSDIAYVYSVSPDGQVRREWENEAGVRLTGYRPEELDPVAGWMSLVHPDDRAAIADVLLRLFAGQTVDHELRFVTKAGDVRWVRTRARPVHDAEGRRVVAIYGAAQDVTLERRAEEALARRSEVEALVSETARRLLSAATQEVPSEVERALGRIGGLLGADFVDCVERSVEPPHLRRVHSWFRDAAQPPHPLLARRDLDPGEFPWLSRRLATGAPLLLRAEEFPAEADPERAANAALGLRAGAWIPTRLEASIGGHLGLFWWAEEPSVSVSQLAPLSVLADVLHVALRRKRSEESLREAERRHRRSEHLASIGTLAAGIAHEIANPVSAIAFNAEHALAARAARDGEAVVEVALKDIVENAGRCGRIIRSVLRLARQEPPERLEKPLEPLVRHALETLLLEAQAAGASVSLDPDLGLPAVPVDVVEMTQVVVNVVRNAIQAAGHDGSVVVRLRRHATGVRIEVEDDGPGMSDEQRRRAFDPFFTTRQRTGGTGLGLSIVHTVVRSHGGSVSLDTEPGRGTVMRIDLPGVAATAAPAPRGAPA